MTTTKMINALVPDWPWKLLIENEAGGLWSLQLTQTDNEGNHIWFSSAFPTLELALAGLIQQKKDEEA